MALTGPPLKELILLPLVALLEAPFYVNPVLGYPVLTLPLALPKPPPMVDMLVLFTVDPCRILFY